MQQDQIYACLTNKQNSVTTERTHIFRTIFKTPPNLHIPNNHENIKTFFCIFFKILNKFKTFFRKNKQYQNNFKTISFYFQTILKQFKIILDQISNNFKTIFIFSFYFKTISK